MVVLARRHSTHLVQGRAIGDLSLRIVGTRRDGQIVRLLAPKCTIGSAEGCTLRLRSAGVQPLNCLILRGARGTVIRAWSPKTRLNGRRFGDALLVAGDRLTIGPIELEVLASGLTEKTPTQPNEAGQTESPTELDRHALGAKDEFERSSAIGQRHPETSAPERQS